VLRNTKEDIIHRTHVSRGTV